MRIAQVENGAIARIFTSATDPVVLNDRTNAFRHLRTWALQNDPMMTRYNLVLITVAPQPTYDSRTHILQPVRVGVGSTTFQETWAIIPRETATVRAELINDLKDRAWELWGRASWTMGRTAWLDHRDALKTHGLSLVQAFDAGSTVDVQRGSINVTSLGVSSKCDCPSHFLC